METVYKVVHRAYNHAPRMSAIVYESSVGLVYAPDLWTRPHIGKIFAFTELADAIFLANHQTSYGITEIWRAETSHMELAHSRSVIVQDPFDASARIRRFWNSDIYIRAAGGMDIKDSTVFCDDLRLVERIGLKTVFKVVRMRDEVLTSAIRRGPYMLEYSTSKFTYPFIGKIFAFDSLQAARNFAGDDGNRIYEAITTKCMEGEFITSSMLFEAFWEDPENMSQESLSKRINSYCLDYAPPGTMYCDDLMLCRRIK